MIKIGLTGSIGMGKSATAAMFARQGLPVFDADRAVHVLYSGAAVPVIGQAFPDAIKDSQVDRDRLGRLVIGNPAAMKHLEELIHPMVNAERTQFMNAAIAGRHTKVVLDIPLLFETDGQSRVDVCVVVSAPASVQRERVLARPGMTAEKFDAILAKQLPDREKRRRAHFVVDSSGGFAYAERQVAGIVMALSAMMGKETR